MNPILKDLLEKRGLKIEELDKDERKDFERWNFILSEDDVTVDKIIKFCEQQTRMIEGKWKNLDNEKIKNERLVIMHTVYKSILVMIKAKAEERKQIELHLLSLLQTK